MIKTDTAIKKIKPTGKRQFFGTDSNLVIRVNVNDSITFIIWYKKKQISLGKFPEMDIKTAKRAAIETLNDLEKRAVDPSATDSMTINEVAKLFSDTMLKSRKNPEAARTLLKVVTNAIGDEQTRGIKKLTLHKIVAPYVAKAQHTQAAAVLSMVRQLMAYAGELDLTDRAYPLKAKVAGIAAQQERERSLSSEEIATFFTALNDDNRIKNEYKLFTKLLLATCLRSSEVRLTKWENVDLDKRVMVIPKELLKTGKSDFVVPLTDLTVDLLTQLKTLTGDHAEIMGGANPKSLPNILKRFQKKIGFAEWVPHDLRRTARTHLGELGILDEIAERCLTHAIKGTHKVYDLSERLAERRNALETWNATLETLIK